MKKYDDVVIGSGISGLTMSLFLALNGRKVLLLEKNPHIGGSIARFKRQGLAFDVGFHFTGGLQRGGLLYNMLLLLGMLELVPPIFFPEEGAGCVFLESENQKFDHPYGIERIKDKLKGYFPKESTAIDKYFYMLQSVCERTPSLDLRRYTFAPPQLDEDFISLDEVLKGLCHVLRG
jgi:all-trans-retinol 13,14-reductase